MDRPGLLRDMGSVCAALGVDIVLAASTTHGTDVVTRVEFEVADDAHLTAVSDELRHIPSVVTVTSSS